MPILANVHLNIYNMVKLETRHEKIFGKIPERIPDVDILGYLHSNEVNWEYVQTLKRTTQFKDETLSKWLNVSVKTFRSYRKPEQEISIGTKEHVLLLLSLIQHGKALFGTIEMFSDWLHKENFYFDNHCPVTYLKTITGIRFVDERLTAMEYGDNV